MLPKLTSVKCFASDLLKEQAITAYRPAAESGGRISQRSAYRIAEGEKVALYPEEIAALCDVLHVEPADLFERVADRQGKRG